MFVLPDEVGGTHPALVEAMGYGNCVLVNDTTSNLEVIAESGLSYHGAEGDAHLREQLQRLIDDPTLVAQYRVLARERADACYRWEDVVDKHADLYRRMVAGSGSVQTSEFESPSGT
jgi:glycosyltransferase involved in cell wall biosynthesis